MPWRIPSAWASSCQKPPSYLLIHIFSGHSLSTELGAALQPVGMCKRQEVEGRRGTWVRALLRTPHRVSLLSSSFALLCRSEVGVVDVLTMYLLCVHILAATLGLRAASVKMAKVNTQCSQPSPTHCSVKTTDRDLDHVETSLGR